MGVLWMWPSLKPGSLFVRAKGGRAEGCEVAITKSPAHGCSEGS